MKTLNLHCDYIKFKALKKALKNVEDVAPAQKLEGSAENCLVVLVAVERGDNIGVSEKAAKDILDLCGKVGAKDVVLYPYAHLSSNLGSPKVAVEVLNSIENNLKGVGVVRAPFGYYKEFEMKVKGHPLAELSREFISKGSELEEDYDPKQLLKEISKSKLDTSKLADNDHRILGRQMDLFSFNEVAPGMVFWHDRGTAIYNELINFMREVLDKRGYQELRTPQILDKKLWQISGHWEKYKENIFLTEYEKRSFAVKPMNCPGGMLVFKNSPKSYKDLPLRVGEFGIVHRQELSGVLGGLFRVIQFTQDDAHVFCTEDQLEAEIKDLMDLMEYVYSKFGFDYAIELSTRPEKRIGSDDIWDKAESALENTLKKMKKKYKINEGDGAFYGPKIDFHLKDSLGRTWQCGTIQLDFSMPERFELEYTDKDNKKKRPIMLHRAIYGSVERFIGILLEHTHGRLPTWLAPIQVKILGFTDRNLEYGKRVIDLLKKEIPGLRIEGDFRQVGVSAKVRDAELMKVPYIIVVGDKEEKDELLAVRAKGEKKVKTVNLKEFAESLKKELIERL